MGGRRLQFADCKRGDQGQSAEEWTLAELLPGSRQPCEESEKKRTNGVYIHFAARAVAILQRYCNPRQFYQPQMLRELLSVAKYNESILYREGMMT